MKRLLSKILVITAVLCGFAIESVSPTYAAGNDAVATGATLYINKSGSPTNEGNNWTTNAPALIYAAWCAACPDTATLTSNNVASCKLSVTDAGKCTYTSTCMAGYKDVTESLTTSDPKCAANTFNVAYANGGGTGNAPTSPTSCSYAGTCNAPANTYSRTGYSFAGWGCTASSGSCAKSTYAAGESISTATTVDGATITLTALWNACSYTVVYNSNKPTSASGTISGSTASSSHTYGTAKNLTTNGYSLTGWTFTGWNTAANGTDATYANGASVTNLTSMCGGSVTLYAQWQARSVEGYVYRNYNSSDTTVMGNIPCVGDDDSCAVYDSAMPRIIDHTAFTNNNLTTLAVPTREGYTFTGIYDARSGGTKYYNADLSSARNWDKTGLVELYAQWTPKQYTVKLDADGGTTCTEETAQVTTSGSTNVYTTYATNVYKDSTRTSAMTTSANAITVPVRTGYTFGGYYKVPACGGDKLISASGYLTAIGLSNGKSYTEDKIWYACWTPSQVPAAKTGLVYNGNAQALVTQGFGGYGTVTYKLSTASTYNTTIPTGTNAGTYAVDYKITDSCTTKVTSGTLSNIQIAKKAPTITLNPTSLSLTYPDTGTVTVTREGDGVVSATSETTAVATVGTSGTTVTVRPVKQGSSTITVKVAEGTNHLAGSKTFTTTVSRGSCVVTFDAGTLPVTGNAGTLTYNGTGTTGTFTASRTGNGTLSVTSSDTSVATAALSGASTSPKTVTATWASAPGTTNIQVTSSQTEQYDACSATYVLTTAKANNGLDLSASSGTITYPSTGTFTITNPTGGALTVTSGTTSVATVSLSGTTVTITPVKAGTSEITVTSAETSTHLAATRTYTVTVNRGTGNTTIISGTITVDSNNAGTLTYSSATMTGTVKVKCADNQKPSGATPNDTTVATAAIATNANTDNTYDVTLTWKKAGSTNVSITCPQTSHYNSSSATLALTTEKASCQVNLEATSSSITYPTANTTFTASSTSGATLTVSSTSVSVATAAISAGTVTVAPVKSGTVTITVTSPETANYKECIATHSFTANKKTFVFSGNGATSGTCDNVVCDYGDASCTARTWDSVKCNFVNGSGASSKVLTNWSTNSTGGEMVELGYDITNRPTTLYAVWGGPTCTVTDTNSATCAITTTSNNRPTATYTCKSGYHYGSSESTTSTTLYGTANQLTVSGTCTGNTITLAWANGGHGTAPTSPASCTYGGTFTMPVAMTATGYTFDKWNVNNKTFSAGQTSVACTNTNLGVYSGTATITGSWIANCLAVTLNPHNGTAGSRSVLYKKADQTTWYSNSTCTTAWTGSADVTPTRTGYTFRGFYNTTVDDVSASN